MNKLNNALNRYRLYAALCSGALFLCLCVAAGADELQDANKLFKQGQHEQALASVNAYLKDKPKDAQARFLKGLILTDQGKTNDAVRVFSELTEDYPELPEPYNNLAVLYAGQGEYEKARIALEMAIRTNPSYATAHENLGDIYAKMASQAYDRALQLDRSNTSTQTKLELIRELFNNDSTRAQRPVKPVVATAAATQATEPKAAEPGPASTQLAQPGTQVMAESTGRQQVSLMSAKQPDTDNHSSHNDQDDVLKTIHAWASAWSSKDVKRYLSFYARDFKVPGGQSRSDWDTVRTESIRKPKFIHVSIENASVNFLDDTHASVTFRQSYNSSDLKAHSKKTLEMVKSDDHWLIQDEQTGK
ncbi:MAG: tetratricopeptide repeat protein [Gallionellaceae bacterium]